MSQGKSIGNVNILDLRSATEQSVADIRKIGNVNIAIVTKETAPLLQRIQTGNINLVVEIPGGVRLHQSFGRLVMGKDFFASLEEPIYILVFGQAILLPDVTIQEIGGKLAGISIFGQALVPAPLSGYLESKGSKVFGESSVYVPLSKYYLDSLTLEASQLDLMPGNTEMTVIGNLKIPQVLPAGLFTSKISKLSVTGRIVCHAENQPEVAGSLVEMAKKMTIIPQGFYLVERPLQLDRLMLEALPAKKLYCTEMVRLDRSVTLQDLSENLEALIANDLVLCPAGLRSVFNEICHPLENRVIFYEGEMWVITDSVKLSESHLAAYPDQVTFLVQGELMIDASIPLALLESKLAKIHNMGLVQCSAEHMRTVRSRMGIDEGKLKDIHQEDEGIKEPGENQTANVNFLAL